MLSHAQGAVRGAIVDDDYFPVEFAGRARALAWLQRESSYKGLVNIGRHYFSVKVRLRSQVTMKEYMSMETTREEEPFGLGVTY